MVERYNSGAGVNGIDWNERQGYVVERVVTIKLTCLDLNNTSVLDLAILVAA